MQHFTLRNLTFENALRGQQAHGAPRRAFTLVELLVVIAILLVLTAFVVLVFNANSGGDKVRSAGRIGQSAMLGARDRALHARQRRGIRLIRDPNDSSLATGFVYLQPIEPNLRYGNVPPVVTPPAVGSPIEIENVDIDSNGSLEPRRVHGYGVDWDLLDQSGQLPFPRRIRIPADTGQWYTFSNVQLVSATAPREVTLDLTIDFVNPDNPPPAPIAVPQSSAKATCEIEIGSEILPNHQPIALPSGVVIDLDQSSPNVVANWPANVPPAPAVNIDLMFSPRGMLTGPLAALGPVHFLLNDIQDATQGLNPIDPLNKGEKMVLTIYPQTGHVATYPIDPTDAIVNATGVLGADGLADDLFHFAKIGSASGQ
jgi:prepilin-type N-terminal cleavage/methylation domain-containing protein